MKNSSNYKLNQRSSLSNASLKTQNPSSGNLSNQSSFPHMSSSYAPSLRAPPTTKPLKGPGNYLRNIELSNKSKKISKDNELNLITSSSPIIAPSKLKNVPLISKAIEVSANSSMN
jgi:hypothetical protein